MNDIFPPRSSPLISDSTFGILSDNFEEKQAYEEKPDDTPQCWYIRV